MNLVGETTHAATTDDAPDSPSAVRPLLRGWLHAGALVAALVAGPILATHARDTEQAFVLSVYALALVCSCSV